MQPEHHRTPALPGLCQGDDSGFKVVLKLGVLAGSGCIFVGREGVGIEREK